MTNGKIRKHVTDQVIEFTKFISQGLIYVDDLMEEHDWDEDGYLIDDWLSVNWDFFLGREIMGFGSKLVPFLVHHLDDVVDELQASRKLMVLAKPDRGTACLKANCLVPDENLLRVWWFVTFCNECYGFYPPFNIVELKDNLTKKKYYVPIKQLQFYLSEIDGVDK